MAVIWSLDTLTVTVVQLSWVCYSLALTVTLVLLIILLKIIVGKSIFSREYHPVKGIIFQFLFNLNQLYDQQIKYGHRNRSYRFLALNHSEIYTTHPPNIHHITKSKFDFYTRGNYHYEVMNPLFGDGIFAVDGDKWRHQRKLASHEFSTRVLRDFGGAVFRRRAASLAEKISHAAENGYVVQMQDLFSKMAMETICEIGFGFEESILNGASDHETIKFMKAFDESNELVYRRYIDLSWKIKRFLNVGTEAKLKKNKEILDEFVYRLIKLKREQLFREQKSQEVKEDILSRFLLESMKDSDIMTDNYLRDIVMNFIIAGKDTVGGTLSWFIHMLCKHPVVHAKVVSEVEEVVGKSSGRNFSEYAEMILEGTLEKMHYLHATLSETLRLFPAVPINGRTATGDDILPDGFKIKKGDGVNYVMYAMGRMTYIWGEDAEVFRPERWLKDGIFQPESPFKFTAFNAGPRICLGKDFAYRQMKIVAIVLLVFFSFKLDEPDKEIKYKTMFTLHMNQSLRVRAYLRST